MGEHGFASGCSQGLPVELHAGQLGRLSLEFAAFTIGHEEAIISRLDKAPCCRVVVCEDGEAAGHGFGDDIAECFGDAREEKGVRAGVVGGKGLSGLHTRKTGFRNPALQPRAVGSVADKDQNRIGQCALYFLKTVDNQVEVLFSGEAAHVEDDWCVGAGSPALTQFFRALMGTVETRIDSAGEQVQPPETVGSQALNEVVRGDEGPEGAVVEASQPCKNNWLQQTETIVPAIAVKIGVETGDNRYLEASCKAQGAPAQRTFRGDVDEVGGICFPDPANPVKGGQAELEFGISRNGESGHLDQLVIPFGFAVHSGRSDDCNMELLCLKSIDKSPQRHGDPVDLWWKGFRYKRVLQSG